MKKNSLTLYCKAQNKFIPKLKQGLRKIEVKFRPDFKPGLKKIQIKLMIISNVKTIKIEKNQ